MAPRDDDKVMAGMLRRTLASSSASEGPAPGHDCPPADLLAAYYEHSLGEDESAQYELHFSQCARCREQLAAMVRAEGAPHPKSTWEWVWSPYLLAPAVAALALAIFFGVHHSTQPTAVNQPAATPLVAMSQPSQPPSQDMAAPKPAAPMTANGNASAGQPQAAPAASNELDSLSKAKQALLPAPSSASQDAMVTARPAAPPSPTLATPEPAPAPNALSDKKVQDLPLVGRNVVQLRAPAKSSDSAIANGVGAAQPSAQSVNQSVEVTAAAADRSVTAETVNRGQTQAPAAMSRHAAAANTLSPGVAAGIAAQKIFQTPNTRVLWRPAAGGFVERSADGGATWQGQSLPGISGEIDAGSSPTPKICWLVGSGGTIFMTKDAVNWKKISPPVSADFSAVTAQDASNATVTAADGRKFQTTDGGKHWKATE